MMRMVGIVGVVKTMTENLVTMPTLADHGGRQGLHVGIKKWMGLDTAI